MCIIFLFDFSEHFSVKDWMLATSLQMLLQLTFLVIHCISFIFKYTRREVLLFVIVTLLYQIPLLHHFGVLIFLNLNFVMLTIGLVCRRFVFRVGIVHETKTIEGV